MDDNERKVDSFWAGLFSALHDPSGRPNHGRTQKQGINNREHTHNNYHGSQNHNTRKIVQTPSGSFTKYIGSDQPQNPNSRFIQIKQNNLNIMDYIAYRGYDYKLYSKANGADYSLGIDAQTMRQPQSSSDDLSSVKVALHPQILHDDQGNPKRDPKSGKLMAVTGQGGYYRFSRGASGSLVGIIQELEHVDQRGAFKVINDMVEHYGKETKFDPLDSSKALPKSPKGGMTHTNGHVPIRKHHHARAIKKTSPVSFENLNHKAVALGNFALLSTNPGTKPLNRLHKLGYSDKNIKDAKLGWMPPNDTMLHAFKKGLGLSKGALIQSNFFNVDDNQHLSARLNDQFFKPIISKNRITGIQTLDKGLHPTQKIYSSGKYINDDLGAKLNGLNPDFNDPGYDHRRTDEAGRRFAKGYLSKKRGIDPHLVDTLMDSDRLRVSLGRKGQPAAKKDVRDLATKEDKLRKNKERFVQIVGKQAYQERKEQSKLKPGQDSKVTIQELGKAGYQKKLETLSDDRKHASYRMNGYPSYIEFPHKLDNSETGNQEKTVGADRINFDPNRDDYTLDPNHGHRGKQLVRDGMHNYGYNVSLGHRKSDNQRELYVFEDPTDALSYMDLHYEELQKRGHPCDILSLSGSDSKDKTIGNYIHNKVDDTGEHYQKIHFGTDNDVHGQKLVMQYTERARQYWDQNHVSQRFDAIVPPYRKDWNDARKYYAHHQDTEAVNQRKVNYSMEEYTDKIISDHTKGMSDIGRRHWRNINYNADAVYNVYLNHGEKMDFTVDKPLLNSIKDEGKKMVQDNRKDGQIYYNFNQDIGRSFSPRELNNSLERLSLKQSQQERPSRDPHIQNGPSDGPTRDSREQSIQNSQSQRSRRRPAILSSEQDTRNSSPTAQAHSERKDNSNSLKAKQKGLANGLKGLSPDQLRDKLGHNNKNHLTDEEGIQQNRAQAQTQQREKARNNRKLNPDSSQGPEQSSSRHPKLH